MNNQIKIVLSFCLTIIFTASLLPLKTYAAYCVDCAYYDDYFPPTCGVKRVVKTYKAAAPKSHVVKPKHHRKHCVIKKIKKTHQLPPCRRYAVGCGCLYIPQNELVEFKRGPAPSGCYVSLECECYNPDRITGDDDPMIYPGMNIDN